MDEATVLRANFIDPDTAQLQVEGRGGVWIADASAAKAKAVKQGDKTTGWGASGMKFSRLLAGDTAFFQQGIQQAKLQCTAPDLLANSKVAPEYLFCYGWSGLAGLAWPGAGVSARRWPLALPELAYESTGGL